MEVGLMEVYILSHYWDTPDNEGNEVMGAYCNLADATADMKADAVATRAHYPSDFWEDDCTWEDDAEIRLGRCSTRNEPATFYCWEIKKVEVR